jgi:hypothetical protein
MAENTFRVGKTQWSKWNDEGREAYNKMRRLDFTHPTGIAEADAVTLKTETARKAVKQGEEVIPEPQSAEKTAADTPNPKPRPAKRQKGK